MEVQRENVLIPELSPCSEIVGIIDVRPDEISPANLGGNVKGNENVNSVIIYSLPWNIKGNIYEQYPSQLFKYKLT